MWANKNRPRILDDVLGQDLAKSVMRGALKKKGEVRAWLIQGVFGGGKTTIARIVAKALACLNPTYSGEACQACASCEAIDKDASPNYHELDAASQNSADDMRALIDEVKAAPIGGSPYRTITLDECHILSKVAQNVLLKTLEETPPFTHIMLVTTDPQKLLETIVSRCVPIVLRPVERALVVERLEKICQKEGVEYEKAALEVIAIQHHGHMRDTITLAETISLAGPLSLENVKKYLYLDLDEYAAKLVIHLGEDWERTIEAATSLSQDCPPHEVWTTIGRVVVQAEFLRLTPNRVMPNNYVHKITDRFAGRLTSAAEWILSDKGNNIYVRTVTDLIVALSILCEKIGGNTIEQPTQNQKKMATAKRFQQQEKKLEYKPDDFAKTLGFEPESSAKNAMDDNTTHSVG